MYTQVEAMYQPITPQKAMHHAPMNPYKDTFPYSVFLGTVAALAFYAKYQTFIGGPSPFLGFVLPTLSGGGFFLIGRLMFAWAPTNRPGRLITERVLYCERNWSEKPMRSFAEVSVWLAVIYSSYVYYQDIIVCTLLGTFSGALATLSSEYLKTEVQKCSRHPEPPTQPLAPDLSAFLPFMLPFAYFLVFFLKLIFDHMTNILLATTLATLAGAAFIFAAELVASWAPTRQAGRVLINRWKYSPRNWCYHPIRSFFEVASWLFTIFATYAVTNEIFLAVRVGTMVAVVICLTDSRLFQCDVHAHCKLDHLQRSQEKASATKVRIPRSSTRTWSITEVAKHNTPEDLWIIIDNKVYDVTSWLSRHPGGSVILKFGGADASDQFAAFHQPFTYERLRYFCIGVLDQPQPVLPCTEDYRNLRKYLWDNGYFNCNFSYYVYKHLVIVAIFSVVCFLVSPYSHWLLPNVPPFMTAALSGAFMALFWQQVAFVAHDVLHNGVVRPKDRGLALWWNLLGWIHGAVLFGISAEKWKEEHNVHHAVTLRPCEDPQFNYLPIWLQSTKELDAYGGPYKLDALTRFLVPFQHYTLLPLCIIVGRFNLCLESIVWAAMHGAHMDLLGMALYWTYYSFFVYMVPGGFYARLSFVLASHCCIGVLHIQLLISHLCTDVFTTEEERQLQFFQFQLHTTRNIITAPMEHWFHGGLEYQIEHHLFPLLPRHNLSAVQPFVRELTAKHGIVYEEMGFMEAIHFCLQDFASLADALVHVHLD